MDQLHEQLFGLTSLLGYKPMVLFTTQTGIDLARYNNYPDDLASPEQPISDKAIKIINHNIIALHHSMSVLPPILASAVHMRCSGKYRMAKGKLSDGCHPTPELSLTWAKRLHYNAQLNFEQLDGYTFINQLYGQ